MPRNMSRAFESVLRKFDNEEREWVIRFRLWKINWFPYRTSEIIFTKDGHEFGPWKWNKPMKWVKRSTTEDFSDSRDPSTPS